MGTSLRAISLRERRGAALTGASRRPIADGASSRSAQVELLVRRVVARALDAFTVLFVMLAMVLLGLAPLMRWASDRVAPAPWGDALAATLTYALIAAVYEVTFLALRGQTPGKDVCKLKVVVAGTGSVPSWRRALVRTLPIAAARLVPGVLAGSLAVIPLGCTVAAGRRRAVHDLLAGTEVVAYDADGDAALDAARSKADRAQPEIDRAELAEVYGPRSVRDLVARRLHVER
jgi:uncharacterized RDD family membrane protein YckC